MSRAGLVYTWEHEGFVIAPMTEHDLLEVVEIEEVPLAYLPGNAVRIKVKAAGRLESY